MNRAKRCGMVCVPPIGVSPLLFMAEAISGAAAMARLDAAVALSIDGPLAGPPNSVSLGRRAIKFLDAPSIMPAVVDMAAETIVQSKPMVEYSNGHTLNSIGSLKDCLDSMRGYGGGELSFPRLELIHGLLCKASGSRRAIAVDNGPSHYAINSMVMAAIGSHVLVKEVDYQRRMEHVDFTAMYSPSVWRSRISYANDGTEMNEPIEADVVYWTNPDPGMLYQPWGSGAGEYMGRDVRRGGFLVIQTDLIRYSQHVFDPKRWFHVFSTSDDRRAGMNGTVLATGFYSMANSLMIYMRR